MGLDSRWLSRALETILVVVVVLVMLILTGSELRKLLQVSTNPRRRDLEYMLLMLVEVGGCVACMYGGRWILKCLCLLVFVRRSTTSYLVLLSSKRQALRCLGMPCTVKHLSSI